MELDIYLEQNNNFFQVFQGLFVLLEDIHTFNFRVREGVDEDTGCGQTKMG